MIFILTKVQKSPRKREKNSFCSKEQDEEKGEMIMKIL